ncbi:MAG: hypothetical protein U0K79_08955 [Phascolarctobacterium sp.]|nr:hypothetical protein [Phascolarctobacterium sp.]
MIKKYSIDKFGYGTHVVRATFLFDETKVVVQKNIGGNCFGGDILKDFTDDDALWLDSKYEVVEGPLTETEDNYVIVECDGMELEIYYADLSKYLVGVEIVDYKEGDEEE